MSTKSNHSAAFLLLCVALGLVAACASEEQAPVEEEAVTRTVTVREAAREEAARVAPGDTSGSPSECTGPPEEVLARQYRLINEGEYGAAYALFAEESKSLVPLEEYEAFFEANAPYSVTDYSFPSADVRGEEAIVRVSSTLNDAEGSHPISVTQELVCEGGAWRVVMREDQAEAFTGAGQEEEQPAQYEAPEPEPSEPEGGGYDATATVTRAVDGDTIEIWPAVEGVEEVRLIGVDTPETKDPSEEVEPYGPDASAFVASELEGREVGIELDAERTDSYGRLLAYVYVGGEMFNETLVEEGYAQTWFIEPNTRHEGALLAAQEAARASAAGIWGLPLDQQCLLANHGNGIGEGSPGCAAEQQETQYETQYEPPAPTPSQAPSAPAGGDVDCSDFGSSAEAQPYLLPGDPNRLDADGDGQACDSLP